MWTLLAAFGGAIVGGLLSMIGAAFALDRARMKRESAVAAAIATDIERIWADLPPTMDSIPQHYEDAAAQPLFHRWVDPLVYEIASVNSALFAKLMALDPVRRERANAVIAYHSHVNHLESVRRTREGIEQEHYQAQQAEAGGAVLPNGRDAVSLAARLTEQREYETGLAATIEADAARFYAVDAAYRRMLTGAQSDLHGIERRRIPRFPGDGEDWVA